MHSSCPLRLPPSSLLLTYERSILNHQRTLLRMECNHTILPLLHRLILLSPHGSCLSPRPRQGYSLGFPKGPLKSLWHSCSGGFDSDRRGLGVRLASTVADLESSRSLSLRSEATASRGHALYPPGWRPPRLCATLPPQAVHCLQVSVPLFQFRHY